MAVRPRHLVRSAWRKGLRLVRAARAYRSWTAPVKRVAAGVFHRATLLRLGAERVIHHVLGRRRQRVMATACWSFPVYSQTFVYQELTQLQAWGVDLRFIYSHLESRKHLSDQFAVLWSGRRKLWLNERIARADYRFFVRRLPRKVDALIQLLCEASGFSRKQLIDHKHFLQAFSFARMARAYRPDYLHSYFFYESTLFSLVASFLLDIPRGVSCYADHMLNDYDLKMVPLHLDLCDVVIATSHRIKQELLGMAPKTDPNSVLVKPNAINTKHFPAAYRTEPRRDQPFRLTCVGRFDPKKGLIYLVDAMRIMRDQHINVECHLVGAWDVTQESSVAYAEQIAAQIKELKLHRHIHLEGRRTHTEISRLLQRSHLFVAPYVELANGDKDGIPTTLLEAMATGVAVVATDAGSMSEVITDGKDGVIVPQRSPDALARAIIDLLENPDRRANLGARATQTIGSNYDVAVCENAFHRRVMHAANAGADNGRRKWSQGAMRGKTVSTGYDS